MNWWYLILGGLATYSMTVLIVRDAGPWKIIKRIRELDRYSKLLKCPFCVSVWIAGFVNLAYFLIGIETNLVILFLSLFAMRAISIMLDRAFTSDYQT